MTEESVIEPVVEASQEPVEQVFEFQPTGDDGNPLGGKQVFKYKTPEELQDKLAKANTELIKLNRKLTRDIRLGTIIEDQIPSDAPRVPAGQYEFSPVPLSAEERLAIVQDFADPENFDRAAQRIVKATIGDPDAIRGALGRAEQRLAAMSAKEEAEAFVRSTPGYFVCPQNFETLANWMIKNNLEPVKANFNLAYKQLGPEGANLLSERPAPFVASPEPVPVAQIPVQEPIPQPVRRPTSSGLTRDVSSDGGIPTSAADKIVYEYQPRDSSGAPHPTKPKQVFRGREAIERMPAEEYKRRLQREKGFRELVEQLDREQQQKQAQRA